MFDRPRGIPHFLPNLLRHAVVVDIRVRAVGKKHDTQTIKKAWSVAATPYPKKTHPLPSILSAEEVAHLIDSSQTRFHRMVLMTLYGTESNPSSLRIMIELVMADV